MTLWPGVPLPLPRLFRQQQCQLDAQGRAVIQWGAFEEVTQDRGEVYLRLWQLDLSNPAAIVRFAKRYGSLNPGSMNFQLDEPALSTHSDVVRAVASKDPSVQALLQPAHREDAGFVQVTPLGDFIAAARFLRDITTAWWILNDDRSLPSDRRRWEYAHDPPPATSRDDALALLHRRFSPLLKRFTLLFEFRPESIEEQNAPVRGALEISPTRGPDDSAQLHEICALELFNHIASQEIYRSCENETCGRPFVRQYGRAEHGQSKRQGVLYCSTSCAQAQAQRMYRRRKKAKQQAIQKNTQ